MFVQLVCPMFVYIISSSKCLSTFCPQVQILSSPNPSLVSRGLNKSNFSPSFVLTSNPIQQFGGQMMGSLCPYNLIIIIMGVSGLVPAEHVLPWPQDAGVHLGPPYTWVTLVVSPAAKGQV